MENMHSDFKINGLKLLYTVHTWHMRLGVFPVGTNFLQSLLAMRKVISGKGCKKIESKILLPNLCLSRSIYKIM